MVKKQCQIHSMCIMPSPLPSVTMWTPLFVCMESIHNGNDSIAAKIYFHKQIFFEVMLLAYAIVDEFYSD